MAFETENLTLDLEAVTSAMKKITEEENSGYSVIATEKDQDTPVAFLTSWFGFDYVRNDLVCFILSTFTSKDHRRRGLFNKLYEAIIEKSRAKEGRYIRLVVDHTNTAAKATYKKIGMEPSIDQLIEIDLSQDYSKDIEFQSCYSRFLDEEEFTIELATQEEIKEIKFENFKPILHDNKEFRRAEAGALKSFDKKHSSEIFLLKQNSEVVGVLGGYYSVCDWTDRKVTYLNDLRLENSRIDESRELTALTFKLLMDKFDEEKRHMFIHVSTQEEWVKMLFKTAGAVVGHYEVFEQTLA